MKTLRRKRLPIGIENFKELIKYHYYYVDKTDFIADTFEDKVALYTRPRRFGKTLNMSMLKYFYSIKEKPENEDEDLFKGLNIEKNPEASEHKNRYPVNLSPLRTLAKIITRMQSLCLPN